MLSYFEDVEVPLKDFNGKPLSKAVYVLVFEGGAHFRAKVNKLCDSFQGKRYHLPEGGHADSQAFSRKIGSIEKKIRDASQMIRLTRHQMH